MIISLIGYMGSGKSHISKLLSKKINFKLIDLDKEISLRNNASISEIFQKKGEIFFRKQERELLIHHLNTEENIILSLGGGTPAYYNNIDLLNEKSVSFYLKANIPTLCERLLKQKTKRPLIANINDEDLPEFIAKHLFERLPFYTKSQFSVATDSLTPEEIVEEIIRLLPHHH
ncbi:MAG: shikimate kinase [Bergeyella zoohelcum]|nr:shikimate kinase [Bergeyella zoohelcum]